MQRLPFKRQSGVGRPPIQAGASKVSIVASQNTSFIEFVKSHSRPCSPIMPSISDFGQSNESEN